MKNYPSPLISLLLGYLITFPIHIFATTPAEKRAEAALERFEINSSEELDRYIQKYNSDGQPLRVLESSFDLPTIRSGKFVSIKDYRRKKICGTKNGQRFCVGNIQTGRAPIGYDDLPEDLIDNPQSMLRDLQEIENKKLLQATLEESPWSDDYWPLYTGILGARYADPDYPNSDDWQKNFNYVNDSKNSLSYFLSLPNFQNHLDTLSPSEKYDILIGDKKAPLTSAMWQEGEEYFKESGKVETWMGICHGWAAAAYMLPRPQKSIELLAADGKTKIKFFPSDIKSLASLLWAKAQTPSRFIGGRCNDKKPKKDKNGRVTSEECFDNNPGSWHLAVVNQIGVVKRSFILDATYDYEVWNQPVHAYKYSYLNLNTKKATKNLKEATIELKNYKNDKFKNYRSEDAKYVVGIAMDVTYVVENDPSHSNINQPKNDSLRTVQYLYDLELNSDFVIVGGEWYNNNHPDFLWTPPVGTKAFSPGDRYLRGTWDAKNSRLPEDWLRPASEVATRGGMPLAKIVEAMISLSRQ